MCGIAGFIGYQNLHRDSIPSVLQHMGDAIHHRGPDDTGWWCDNQAQVGLVHQRLSILDLSSAGHQPMVSDSSRFVIVFNGEIYNHLELRLELDSLASGKSTAWRGHSDTETLLAGIDAWGLEATLRRTVGMFALALWDKNERSLYLARDRMGEKPLYFGWQQGVFLFGSELKALKAHPAFKAEIDRGAIALQMRHNYIPAPYSIYSGINKLQPGYCVKVTSSEKCRQSEPWPYWSFQKAVEYGRFNPFTGNEIEAVNELDTLLRSAVAQQMIADVSLGAFLSGGVDSSTIVALMQSQSSRPVKTFTVGFNEASYNEAVHAKAVAEYLGTEHTELYVTPQQTLDVIPRLPALYDEPFSDSSQVPTFLVSEMTRRHVTVSLSGDAGDELFGGYNRYVKTQRWWESICRIPPPLRRLTGRCLKILPSCTWDQFGENIARITGNNKRWHNLGNLVSKLADVLAVSNNSGLYRHFVTHWPDPASIVINGVEPPTQVTQPQLHLNNILEQMMALDSLSYLPDDILCKVDRAAMGVSLETRVPMLDHRVVEFAWRLPLDMKIRDGQGKWILREVLYKYVPRELIERPKMGFSVPIDSWLRGPLRDWAESLLNEARLRQEGYFDPAPIRQKWAEHLSGRRNWQYHLWDVLMFQAWLEGIR
ncbi:asparagine synthase (glutamine-hydrolyzing) [Salinisphaera sp. G21_0]|uniref:asparagine synthase (glutamine-hydrolyzing) n=1 Tax=Salinisphaera sp. G21_0 TaxID=2821094 RepID=UPI001ADC3B83|nr:asparagine synthase (glutamine-hydrolyzing) [Salinisphaera sp. G21_0]MBO9480328.1 asparagine synthase (glutamine-hydrolyzing) [Salinisphaera sp. G21_0]